MQKIRNIPGNKLQKDNLTNRQVHGRCLIGSSLLRLKRVFISVSLFVSKTSRINIAVGLVSDFHPNTNLENYVWNFLISYCPAFI